MRKAPQRGPVLPMVADIYSYWIMSALISYLNPLHSPRFSIIAFLVIMPNHTHGIIAIVGANLVGARIAAGDSPKRSDTKQRAGTRPAPAGLGNIVGAFKSITMHEYIRVLKQLAFVLDGW
jgi:hypothetical protein